MLKLILTSKLGLWITHKSINPKHIELGVVTGTVVLKPNKNNRIALEVKKHPKVKKIDILVGFERIRNKLTFRAFMNFE